MCAPSAWPCGYRVNPPAERARDMKQGAVTSAACAFHSWLQVLMARKTSQIKLDARHKLLLQFTSAASDFSTPAEAASLEKKMKEELLIQITPVGHSSCALFQSHVKSPVKFLWKAKHENSPSEPV